MNHMKQLIRHFCVLDCWRTFNMYHIHPTYSNIFQNEIHISYSFIFHIPYIYTVYIHSFNILMLIVFGWIGNSSIWRHKKWPSGRDLLIWKRVSVPCVVGFCVNPWPSFVLDGRSPVTRFRWFQIRPAMTCWGHLGVHGKISETTAFFRPRWAILCKSPMIFMLRNRSEISHDKLL